MKIRTDFVTNSSSSSFIIEKYKIPFEEREKVFKILNKLDILTPEDVMLSEYERDIYNDNDFIIEPGEYDDNIIRIYSQHDGAILPELEDILDKYGTDAYNFDLDVLDHIKQIYTERYKKFRDMFNDGYNLTVAGSNYLYKKEKKIKEKGYKEKLIKNFCRIDEEVKECE